jgi:hypothetical protein
MPSIERLGMLPVIPGNWREVTSEMAEKAQMTAKLANVLLISLGKSTVVQEVDSVEYRIETALGEGNSRVRARSLTNKIMGIEPSDEPRIREILMKANMDSTAIINAHDALVRNLPVVLLDEIAAIVVERLPDTPSIRSIAELGTSKITHIEIKGGKAEITTDKLLLEALKKEFASIEYYKRKAVKEASMPKQVVKEKVTEEAPSIPGVSYSIDEKKAKPLNMLNRMGATSEAKLTRALKKCSKSESGYVDVTKGTVMFMNLITRNFVATFEGKPVNAVILLGGSKFKVSKLPNDQYGFRIKKVK